MSDPQPFQLTENEISPGCREIRVEGELDLAVADQLKSALARAEAQEGTAILGLEDCQFIDSTGIAIIVDASRRFAAAGGRLALYAPSDQVLRILSVSGLTSSELVFETLEEALAADGAGR